MIIKQSWLLGSILLLAGAVPVLHGETISFPKENPVFTFELPKELKAVFDKPDHLVFGNGSFYLFETSYKDEAAVKNSLDKIISVPCERHGAKRTSKEPASEIKESPGLMVVEAACTGSFDSGPNIRFLSRIISIDRKRFFEFGFYDEDFSKMVEAMTKSIKPVSQIQSSTTQPEK